MSIAAPRTAYGPASTYRQGIEAPLQFSPRDGILGERYCAPVRIRGGRFVARPG